MAECQKLLKDLENLSLSHKSVVNTSASESEKSEPDYVVDLSDQASGTDSLIAAASSSFSIHLMSLSNLEHVNTIKGHTQTLTKVQFCKSNPHLLYSSSKDKSLRCWDVRTSKQAQSFKLPAPISVEVLSMDVSQTGRLLCAGTEAVNSDSYLLFWDSRQPSVLGCYSECHQDDITQVSFQPGSERNLASGGSDGLVCTFDLAETSEDDALQATCNAESDVARIGWCGNENSSVYAVTSDNTFHVWDGLEGDVLCSIEDWRNQPGTKNVSSTDYILDCIPSLTATDKTHQSSAVLLAGTYSGNAKMLWYREEEDLSTLCSLPGGHSAPLRCSLWNPETRTLLTGSEDSLVCLWSIEQSLPPTSLKMDSKRTPKGKVKSKGSVSTSGRKPYARPKR